VRDYAAGVAAARAGQPASGTTAAFHAGFGGEVGRAVVGEPTEALVEVGRRLAGAGVPSEHRDVALREAAWGRVVGLPLGNLVDDEVGRALVGAAAERSEPCDVAARPPAPALEEAWATALAPLVERWTGGACAPTRIGWSPRASAAWDAALARPGRGSGAAGVDAR
jgi:hypothetical protein